jgi:hypothetical protein
MRDWAPSEEAIWQVTEPCAPKAEQGLGTLALPLLDRERVVLVYKALQRLAKASGPMIWEDAADGERECVTILEELGLVCCLGGTGPWTLSLAQNPKKRDLTTSFRYNIYSNGTIEV